MRPYVKTSRPFVEFAAKARCFTSLSMTLHKMGYWIT